VADLLFTTAISANSWPMVMYNQLWVYQSSMTNCIKAESLADWLYWTMTDSGALSTASRFVTSLTHSPVAPMISHSSLRDQKLRRVAQSRGPDQQDHDQPHRQHHL
jgi:hypothetical protein